MSIKKKLKIKHFIFSTIILFGMSGLLSLAPMMTKITQQTNTQNNIVLSQQKNILSINSLIKKTQQNNNNNDSTNLSSKSDSLISDFIESDINKFNDLVQKNFFLTWFKDFVNKITNDKSIEAGSRVAKFKEKFLKQKKQSVQHTENFFNFEDDYEHIYNALKTDFIDLIFGEIFLSYEREKNSSQIYSAFGNANDINEASKWTKIKFHPNVNTSKSNKKFKESISRFQAFVFDQWMRDYNPLIIWDQTWKYSKKTNSNLSDIYKSQELNNQGLNLPSDPNYKYPLFNTEDKDPQFKKWNEWLKEIKDDSYFNEKTKSIDTSKFSQKLAWKLYSTYNLPNVSNGYLNSGLHHHISLIQQPVTSPPSSTATPTLINKIEISNNKNFSDDQKKSPLFLFLSKDEKSGNKEMKINSNIVNNIGELKEFKYISPLVDIEVTQNNKKIHWTAVRNNEGVVAVTTDGTKYFAENSFNKEKHYQYFLWRLAQEEFKISEQTLNNFSLKSNIKEYFSLNIPTLFNKYFCQEKNSDNNKSNMATQVTTVVANVTATVNNNEAKFSDEFKKLIVTSTTNEKSQKNYLIIEDFLQNNNEIWDLLKELIKYNKITSYQYLINTGNTKLINHIKQYVNVPFDSMTTKGNSLPTIDWPLINGLATPYFVARDFDTAKNAIDIKLDTTSTSSKKKTQLENTGEFPIIRDRLQNSPYTDQDLLKHDALFKWRSCFKIKLAAWLKKITLQESTIQPKKYYFSDRIFNYSWNQFIFKDEDKFNKFLINYHLAKEIKIDLEKNKFDFKTHTTNWSNKFSFSDTAKITQAIENAVKNLIYSSSLKTKIPEFDITQLQLSGGFKIEENEEEPEKKYLSHKETLWNLWQYHQSLNGFSYLSSANTQYLQTLYTFNWLIKDDMANFKEYWKTKLSKMDSAQFVWIKHASLNDDKDAGKTTEDTNGNNKLTKPDVFKFANNDKFYKNPYWNIDNKAVDYKSINSTDLTQLSPFISSAYFGKVTTAPSPPPPPQSTNKYETLSNYYGIILNNFLQLENIPEEIKKLILSDFSKANPDGNMDIDTKTANILEKAKGSLYSLAMRPKNGSSSTAKDESATELIKQIDAITTIKGLENLIIKLLSFNKMNSQLLNINNAKSDKTLLKQKNALKNLINGYAAEMNSYVSENLWNTVEEKKTDKKSEFYFDEKNVERFAGFLQDPKTSDSSNPENKYFIPKTEKDREGYLVYLIQFNYSDFIEGNFEKWVKYIGLDLFTQAIMQTALDVTLQNDIIANIPFEKNFQKYTIIDERLHNLALNNWSKKE